MIATLVIGVLAYVALLWSQRTHTTPDGQFYMAMGRGMVVPRPYAYRHLPRLLNSAVRWRLVHAGSYVLALASMHVAAERFGVSGTSCAMAVMFLPAFRQSVSWPVLLDMPILAISTTVAAFSVAYPVIALGLLMLSGLVHERAPIWAALFSVPFLPLPLALAFVVIAVCATLGALTVGANYDHSGTTGVDWMDKPFQAAINKHKTTITSYNAWMRPLGASVLGLAFATPWALAAVVVGYAGCLVAQDRARIYSYAAFPLTLLALQHLGPWGALIPLVNWFVPNTEV